MQNIILSSVTATFLAIGLTACGGGGGGSSSKTEEISKREYVMIFHHYPKDVCKSSYLKNNLRNVGATDIITSVENGDVTCATYGKKNDRQECRTSDSGYDSEPTCVIGMNGMNNSSNYYNSKLTDNALFLENMQDVIVEAY